MNTMNAQEQRTAGESTTVDRGASTQRETARQAESVRPAASAEVQTILRQEAAVRRSFTGVQDTLGESGRKAFQDAYRRGTDRGNYTGEFLRAYHAGMTGQKNPNGTSDVSFAAYTAGKNDAAASLAREKRAAQFAGTAGTDSGLVFDSYVENRMDSAVADEVNAVAKALGVRVQMVDQVLGGQGNGQISGSDVLIAKDTNNPVLQVVGHEWTHRVQELAPDTYRSFRDAVGSLPDVQDAVQILVKQYNEAGIETSYEQALDEATANYAGEMIENSNVLDDFIRKHSTDRTLLQKLRDAIHEIVGKLTGRAKRQAQTVEGKLQAAFEAAAKQAERLDGKSTATEGGGAQTANGIRYSAKMSFEDQVDAVLDRELDRNSSVYVMDTPEMLQSLGLKDYPMLMTQRHILDIVHEKSSKNTHWHGLSGDMVKQLPSMIENPVMILESATKSGDAVIITSELDGDGLPVVVSVHPDGSGQYNRAEIASNFITSMYGKDGFEGFISSAVDDGRVLYNNKKRTRTLFANAGLQLPGSLLRDGFFRDTVSQDGGNVKPRFSLKPGENYIVDLDDSNIDQIKENMTWDEASELLDTQHGLSYRFYSKNNPMSRSGYAMFADDYYRNGEAYGGDKPRAFSVDENDLTDIDSLTDKIIEARHETDKAASWELENYENVSDEEFAQLFDPDDIVDSAVAWDNEELASWFYESVAEPNNIGGVKTYDGAIVFDPVLIKRNIPAEIVFTKQTSPRHSLKGTENARELAALKRENESLKERMEYWKGQTRRSQGVTTDQKSVAKAADALVKDYGAEISGSEIAGELQSLYDYIASGKDGKGRDIENRWDLNKTLCQRVSQHDYAREKNYIPLCKFVQLPS